GPSGSYVVGDAVRIEWVGEATLEADIEVSVDGTALTHGSGSVSFGTTALGAPVTRTFTVRNVGGADLVLGAITLPAGFSAASGLDTSLLAPGAADSFVVQLDALFEGNYSGTLEVASNDGNESPFEVTLSGTVDVPGTVIEVTIVDDGDDGYSATG